MADVSEAKWEEMSESEQDALVEEVQASRMGDEEEGAEKAELEETEHVEDSGGADETPGAADAGHEEEAAEGDEKVEGSKEAQADWHDDAETFDIAKRMGISEEDFLEIQSREELDRVMRAIDRKAYDSAKASQQQAAAPTPAKSPAATAEQQPPDVMVEVEKLFGDKFDDDTKKTLADAMRLIHGRQEQELKSLRDGMAQFQQAEQQRVVNELNRKIDAAMHDLKNPDRYGKPGEKPTRQQAANQEKFRRELLFHGSVHESQGRNLSPAELSRYADATAFLDDNKREAQRQYDERLKKQSHRITGGTSKRGLPKPVPEDKAGRKKAILDDPEIEAEFQRAVGGGR